MIRYWGSVSEFGCGALSTSVDYYSISYCYYFTIILRIRLLSGRVHGHAIAKGEWLCMRRGLGTKASLLYVERGGVEKERKLRKEVKRVSAWQASGLGFGRCQEMKRVSAWQASGLGFGRCQRRVK